MRQFGRRIKVKDLQKQGLMRHCLILLHLIYSSTNENAAYFGIWTGWKVVGKVQDQRNIALCAKTA